MIRLLLPANIGGEVLPVGKEIGLTAEKEAMYVAAGSAEYVVDEPTEEHSEEVKKMANVGTTEHQLNQLEAIISDSNPDTPDPLVEESVDTETGEVIEKPTASFGRSGKTGRSKK